MDRRKLERIERARVQAAERRQKAMTSLRLCFARSEVMRLHHDALVQEVGEAGGVDAFSFSTPKRARFVTYISYWFAGLSAVIERYQELVAKGTIGPDPNVDTLLRPEMIDLVKPFRNAVAHCPDHDDDRVLRLLGMPESVPDWAQQVAQALRAYLKE